MLNSQNVEFMNISENKVLANKSELSVFSSKLNKKEKNTHQIYKGNNLTVWSVKLIISEVCFPEP